MKKYTIISQHSYPVVMIKKESDFNILSDGEVLNEGDYLLFPLQTGYSVSEILKSESRPANMPNGGIYKGCANPIINEVATTFICNVNNIAEFEYKYINI